MKKMIIAPIAVLAAICLVISGALALTNSVTDPIIVEAQRVAAEKARAEVLPGGEGFTLLEVSGLPEAVTEVYVPSNHIGYVMMLTTKGFGGKISMILGMDNDGLITGVKVLTHAETSGIGTKVVASDEFAAQFIGKDAALDGVDTVSGATVSSNAFLNGVRPAFEAYEIIQGVAK